MTGARVAVTAPSGKATASVEATMTQGKNGPMTGQATVDTVMVPVNGKPIRITADVPEWRLVDDGEPLQFAVTHAVLALPEHGAVLSRASTGWRTSPTKQDH